MQMMPFRVFCKKTVDRQAVVTVSAQPGVKEMVIFEVLQAELD
jgi:hypothetical protein